MPKTIALVNMKGGVGKSTLTVNLAWFLADYHSKRVLVVDLDPQFNASQYLLGPFDYERHLRAGRPTVWNVLEQHIPTPTRPVPTPVNLAQAIVTPSTRPLGGCVELLPSQLELAFTLLNPQYRETELADALQGVADRYDIVLIDCAPTESVLTRAAYLASSHLLVPGKPEYLSTIGLPLLVNSMANFSRSYPAHPLQLAGVVFNATTEYAPEEMRAKAEVRQVAQQNGWHVFDQEVRYSRSYPKGAREGRPINRTSYSRGRQISCFRAFTDAFCRRLDPMAGTLFE